ATDEDLARLEVEVATAAPTAERRQRPVGGPVGIGEARTDVRLVRRLVLREPDVAVDAERRPARVRRQRDPASRELLVEGQAEGFQGLLQQALVVALARL